MSEGIEMFILPARRAPSHLLKVEMIMYIGKWNVCPDRNIGNKIIIVFRGTDAVHLQEGEKARRVEHVNVWAFGAAVQKTMVISFEVMAQVPVVREAIDAVREV